MEATILDITTDVNNSILVKISFSNGADYLNFNNMTFNGTNCTEMVFSAPINRTDASAYLTSQIEQAIQDRLLVELTKLATQKQAAFLLAPVQTYLIGKRYPLTTFNVSNVDGTGASTLLTVDNTPQVVLAPME